MNKKASFEFMLIMLILGALFLMVITGMAKKVFFPASVTLSERDRKVRMEACEIRGKEMGEFQEIYVADKYPDSCDICKYGDSTLDRDADGMPDLCDSDDRNSNEADCNKDKGLFFDDDLSQCICNKKYTFWDLDMNCCKKTQDSQECKK